MSIRRLLIGIAFVCELLAAVGVNPFGVALVPAGLAFYFAAEFV